MTLWIDPPAWPAHGRLWSHLVSDTSVAELLAFGDALGLSRRGFDADHYDVPAERYREAIAAGARPVPGRELLARLTLAGLRVPKRKGERLVASRDHDDTTRWELLYSPFDVSALSPPGAHRHVLGIVDGIPRLGWGPAELHPPARRPLGYARLRPVAPSTAAGNPFPGPGSAVAEIRITDALVRHDDSPALTEDPEPGHWLWPLIDHVMSYRQ